MKTSSTNSHASRIFQNNLLRPLGDPTRDLFKLDLSRFHEYYPAHSLDELLPTILLSRTDVHSLLLHSNILQACEFDMLIELLPQSNLTHLDLGGCNVTPRTLTRLVPAITQSPLLILDLGCNNTFGGKKKSRRSKISKPIFDMAATWSALLTSSLRALDVSRSKLSDEFLSCLSGNLSDSVLIWLDLSQNVFSTDGWMAFASALPCCLIEELVLKEVGLTNEQLHILFCGSSESGPKKTTMDYSHRHSDSPSGRYNHERESNLPNSRASLSGVSSLASWWPVRGVKRLDLSYNPFDDLVPLCRYLSLGFSSEQGACVPDDASVSFSRDHGGDVLSTQTPTEACTSTSSAADAPVSLPLSFSLSHAHTDPDESKQATHPSPLALSGGPQCGLEVYIPLSLSHLPRKTP